MDRVRLRSSPNDSVLGRVGLQSAIGDPVLGRVALLATLWLTW